MRRLVAVVFACALLCMGACVRTYAPPPEVLRGEKEIPWATAAQLEHDASVEYGWALAGGISALGSGIGLVAVGAAAAQDVNTESLTASLITSGVILGLSSIWSFVVAHDAGRISDAWAALKVGDRVNARIALEGVDLPAGAFDHCADLDEPAQLACHRDAETSVRRYHADPCRAWMTESAQRQCVIERRGCVALLDRAAQEACLAGVASKYADAPAPGTTLEP